MKEKTRKELLEEAMKGADTDEKKQIAYLTFVLAETVQMYGNLMKDHFELSMKYQRKCYGK